MRYWQQWILVAGVVGSGALGLAPMMAVAAETRHNEWEVAPEMYYFHYREPNVAVTFAGPMYGLAGSFTHHHANRVMLKAEGRGAAGSVDYRGSGTIHGITDFVLEGRLLAGYDVLVGDTRGLTPFLGVGYRYLNDDSSGKTSSTGAAGYDRESRYFYSPLGVEYRTPLGDQWHVTFSGEYDLFWRGQQNSHLEDVHRGFNTVSNAQTRGYGARGAVKFSKPGPRVDWVIEPFVRWWSIRDSRNANVTFSGVIIGYGYEPKNETFEVGAKVGVRF